MHPGNKQVEASPEEKDAGKLPKARERVVQWRHKQMDCKTEEPVLSKYHHYSKFPEDRGWVARVITLNFRGAVPTTHYMG